MGAALRSAVLGVGGTLALYYPPPRSPTAPPHPAPPHPVLPHPVPSCPAPAHPAALHRAMVLPPPANIYEPEGRTLGLRGVEGVGAAGREVYLSPTWLPPPRYPMALGPTRVLSASFMQVF